MYKKYSELRNKQGYFDYEVSKKTGISTSTLTNWKYGRYTPKINKLKILADFFNVSIDYFLDDTKTIEH